MPKSKAKKENSHKTSSQQAHPAPEVENMEVLVDAPTQFNHPDGKLVDEKIAPTPETEFTDPKIEAIVNEIVDHFNTLPKEQDDRILNIIETQTERLQKKTASFEIADKKFVLAKKALRKAKDHKLDKEKIRLIKFERKHAKKERKRLKRMLKKEKQSLKNIRKIIRLLQLTD
jgi:hypothetical protein